MTSIKHKWFFGALLLLVLSARPGSAATIDIVSGSLVLTSPFAGDFHLVGAERGLVFDGHVSFFGAHVFPSTLSPLGTTAHINILQDFSDLHGTVTLDGVTYEVGTGVFGVPQAGAHFTGPGVILPPLGGDPIVLTSPFVFQGFFRELDNGQGAGAQFAGSGLAALTYVPWTVPGPGGWLLESAEYSIVPVPEPATGFLLLTGLTGIVGRRLLRRAI